MNDTEIKEKIMHRVKTIYWFRKLIHPIGIKSAILFAGIFGTSSMVSVPSVLTNLKSESPLVYTDYFLKAFLQTEIAVQLMLSVTLIVALWVFFELMLKLSNRLSLRYR